MKGPLFSSDLRVGSEAVQNLAGLVESGQELFEMSRAGSGRVDSGQEGFNFHGTGRVTPAQPDSRDVTRPVKTPDMFVSSRNLNVNVRTVSYSF